MPAELLEQRGLDEPWVQDGLEPSRRQFLDLLLGQLDSVALRDPRADVAHDLLDIRLVAARSLLTLRLLRLLLRTAPVRTTAVRTPAAAMEVSAPPLRW